MPLQSPPAIRTGLTLNISLFAVILFTSCTSLKKYNQQLTAKHSPTQLKADLQIIKTSLEQAHPGLYWYISKPELDQKFSEINTFINDSLNSLSFYRKVAPIISEIKCGHTRLVYPGLKLTKHQQDSLKKKGLAPVLQFSYRVDSQQLYIENFKNKGLGLKKGMQILSIDGIAANEIINKTRQLFSSDGYNQTFYDEVLNKSFATYYKLAYPQRDSSYFIFKDSTGDCALWIRYLPPSINKKKLSEADQLKKQISDKAYQQWKRQNRYKGIEENKQTILDFSIDSLHPHMAILKIKSFSFEHANFHRFYRESFRIIKQKKIKELVLDLRDNGGGYLNTSNLLFRYLYPKSHQYTGRSDMVSRNFSTQRYIDRNVLEQTCHTIFYPFFQLAKQFIIGKDSIGYYAKLSTGIPRSPKKNVYTGNLTVMINGFSFSASALLSANLQYLGRAKFIGEETGGGYNKCTAGTIPYLKLPHTGLKLRLPLKVIRPNFRRELEGRGVFPDPYQTDK